MPNWIKYPLTLLVVAVVSALLLAGLNRLTDPQKEKLRIEVEKNAKKMIMPDANSFENKGKCDIALDQNNQVVGYIATGEGRGYSSNINIMVSTDKEMNILGSKVLYQKETPGLGDKIEEIKSSKTWGTVLTGKKVEEGRPWFMEQFLGKRAPFNVTKDGGEIEAVTGATISSRAVCRAINEALDKIKECIQETTTPEPSN